MPELTPGSEYLVAFLHEAGTVSSNGMGLVGLSWAEIDAWVKCTNMENIVTPRDLKMIHMLSRMYASEASKASQKGAVAPYVPEVELEEEMREVISEAVEDVFAGMLASQDMRGKV